MAIWYEIVCENGNGRQVWLWEYAALRTYEPNDFYCCLHTLKCNTVECAHIFSSNIFAVIFD